MALAQIKIGINSANAVRKHWCLSKFFSFFLMKKQTIHNNINQKQINKVKQNIETKITTSQKKADQAKLTAPVK